MALQNLLKSDGPTDPYLEILRQRLANIGEKLVKKISASDSVGPNSGAGKTCLRLVYYRDDGFSGLLLACD